MPLALFGRRVQQRDACREKDGDHRVGGDSRVAQRHTALARFFFEVIRQIAGHRLHKPLRRASKLRLSREALLQHHSRNSLVPAEVLEERLDRGPDQRPGFRCLVQHVMNQLAQGVAALLDQRQPELIHVAEMPVEGRRCNTGQLGDLPQAERIETPPRGQLGRGCIEQFLARFRLLLLPCDL